MSLDLKQMTEKYAALYEEFDIWRGVAANEQAELESSLAYAKAAINSIRDAVLNGRSQLEGMAVDNDIINAVLGIIDDATADIDAARVVVEKGQPCVR